MDFNQLNKYKITLQPHVKQALDIIAILALLYTIYWLTTPSGSERLTCIIYEPTIKLAQNCSAQFEEGGALVCVPQSFAQLYKLSQSQMRNVTIKDYGNFTFNKPVINVTWVTE